MTYAQQATVAEDVEQGVHVALASEVEPGPDMPTRRHHASRVPEPPEGMKDIAWSLTGVQLQSIKRSHSLTHSFLS